MKKILLLASLLTAACDDSSSKSSNTPPVPVNGPSAQLTQKIRDVEFFRNNPEVAFRTAKACENMEDDQSQECRNAYQGLGENEVLRSFKNSDRSIKNINDISVEGLLKSEFALIGVLIDCVRKKWLSPDHPICIKAQEAARQLLKKCPPIASYELAAPGCQFAKIIREEYTIPSE